MTISRGGGGSCPARSDRSVSRSKNLDEEDSDDYTSSSGSSSEGDSSDDGDENHKPLDEGFQTSKAEAGSIEVKPNHTLSSRLAAILPLLERANRDLEQDGSIDAHRVDEVGEDVEHYVEMNLSLGVLSEGQRNDAEIRVKDDDGTNENIKLGDTSGDEQTNHSQPRTQQMARCKVEEV